MPNAGDISCDLCFHAKSQIGLLGAWNHQNAKNPISRIRCFSHIFRVREKRRFRDPKFDNFGVFHENVKNHGFSWFLFSRIIRFREKLKFKIEFYKFFDFIKTIFRILPKHYFQKYENNVFPINIIFAIFFKYRENHIYPEKYFSWQNSFLQIINYFF